MSNLKLYPTSVMWETEQLPPCGKSQQSSSFDLFGEKWNLTLEQSYCYNYEFYVRLSSVNCQKTIKTAFSATCHVIVNGQAFGGTEQFPVQKPDCVILKHRAPSYDYNGVSGSRKWKIYCYFSCDVEPLPLQTRQLSAGSSSTSSKSNAPTGPGIPPDLQRLSDEFSRLLVKEIIPDASLTSGGKTWRVHRSVLTVRSEVFAAMFRSGMSESKTGEVRIEDLEPTVVDSLLKYVYSGKVPEVSGKNVTNMYKAADKYALHGLRKLLSNWMADHLTIENCLGFLVAADAHSDAELKDVTTAFIAEHFVEMEKAVWAKFRKEHLHLVVEVLEYFAPSMKK